MKRILLQTFWAILISGAVSCSVDSHVDPEKSPGQREICFTISDQSMETRASATAFATGDSIGIFVVKRSDQAVAALPVAENNYAGNVKWVKTEAGWEPATVKDKLTYPKDGGKLDFYAYYPYHPGTKNPLELAFSVKSDQTTAADFTTSDLMLAVNTVGMSEGKVPLLFTHQLALVEVTIHGDALTGATPDVFLVGLLPQLTVNLSQDVLPEPTGKADMIKMNRESADAHVYRALIPAQTAKQGLPLFRCVIGGVTYRYKAEDAVVLAGKEKKKFEITLK